MLNMVCVPLTISVTFSYEDSALIGFHKQYVKWLVTEYNMRILNYIRLETYAIEQ